MRPTRTDLRQAVARYRARSWVVSVDTHHENHPQRTKVVVRSPYSGTESSLVVRTGALLDWLAGGKLIQNAFPDLSESDRELLMTGYTQDDWDEMFGDDDEEDDDLQWTDQGDE